MAQGTAQSSRAFFSSGHATEHIACRLEHDSDQTIATSTVTLINFNSEIFDTGGFHDNTTNNTRITIPVDGLYLIGATVRWGGTTVSGVRQARMLENGTTYIASARIVPESGVAGGDAVRNNLQTIVRATTGTYYQLSAYQNTGVSQTVVTTTDEEMPSFWIVRISD